ncbi:MAG TPA: hypothetical protein VNW29_02035 [Candidatus Sulfotelmatobacter sp.]|nr:hypothetical protein [Candidatus Sulfotelmatobacter sp.]
MMKNLRKHFWHYLIYLVIFCGGLSLVLFSKGNTNLEATMIIMTAFIYFVWAMVHHYVHHQLHPRIVIEYILIIVLGTLLTLFLFGV